MKKENFRIFKKAALVAIPAIILPIGLTGCKEGETVNVETESTQEETVLTVTTATQETTAASESTTAAPADTTAASGGVPSVSANEKATAKSIYTDANGDKAYIPKEFTVSAKSSEQTIDKGLVVIGPDGSEYVWVPTSETKFTARDFGRYFYSGESKSDYYDETDLPEYREMEASIDKYGGFYISRYEASRGDNGLPASKRVSSDQPGSIMVQYSPQNATESCKKLYDGNDTVQGFFAWGANWDTALQWLIDSGNKTSDDISSDSTSWGNYSNDSFSEGARGNYTGIWEEANANNIYDLAGNNWEWTQERKGSNYVMRGGGYSLMGGGASGDRYPASIRDPLPGNSNHPNVAFRIGLYIE